MKMQTAREAGIAQQKLHVGHAFMLWIAFVAWITVATTFGLACIVGLTVLLSVGS